MTVTTTTTHIYLTFEFMLRRRAAGGAVWLRHCATDRKVVGSIPDGVVTNYSHLDATFLEFF
jgi:hypothetical protein